MATKEVYCRLHVGNTFTLKQKVELQAGKGKMFDPSIITEISEAKETLKSLSGVEALNYMGALGWELITGIQLHTRLMDYLMEKKVSLYHSYNKCFHELPFKKSIE